MQQDGCRRNRYFEKFLILSKHVGPAAAATISIDAVTSRETTIVSTSAIGTYDWNHPGLLDRHENGCKERRNENDQRAN
jgi:hypothetical protein